MRAKLHLNEGHSKSLILEVDRILCDHEGLHYWLHGDQKTERFISWSEMLAYKFSYEVVESGKHYNRGA